MYFLVIASEISLALEVGERFWKFLSSSNSRITFLSIFSLGFPPPGLVPEFHCFSI